MANLDRRLIPFIEMLTELGLDWLAFELIDGVRRGREPAVSPEVLKLAREHVRTGKSEVTEYDGSIAVESDPLVGDEQLDWVARYVDERIYATLTEMAIALDNIDRIVDSTREDQATIAPLPDTMPQAAIVLLDGDEQMKVGRHQIEEAQTQIPILREALAKWLASTRQDLAQ